MHLRRESENICEVDSRSVPGTRGALQVHRTLEMGGLSESRWTLSHKLTGYAIIQWFPSRSSAENFGKGFWGMLSSRSRLVYTFSNDSESIQNTTPKRAYLFVRNKKQELNELPHAAGQLHNAN